MIRLIYLSAILFLSTAAYAGNDVIRETLELPEFHSVSVNSSYAVYIKQGNKQEVNVEALRELYELSEFKVVDGVLHINMTKNEDTKSKSFWAKIDDIKLAPTLKVMITMKNVRDLQVNGAGKIITENSIASPKINLLVSGSGSIELDLKGQTIDTEISGSGTVKIKGYASAHKIHMSGSGSLNAFGLEVEKAVARLSGSGTCEIFVTDNLKADIFGTAQLLHKGDTKTVSSSVLGQGAVSRSY